MRESQLTQSSASQLRAESYAAKYSTGNGVDRPRASSRGQTAEGAEFSFFPYPRVTADGASMRAESRSRRQSSVVETEDFASQTREQLLTRLRIERMEKLELQRLVAVLKEGGDGQLQLMAQRLEEATKELVGLREQNYRLKNIANDELVMLQKVETKELYGKKTKVQQELDAARAVREEYDKLLQILKTRENRIYVLESEAQQFRAATAHAQAEAGREINGLKALLERLKAENAALRQQPRIAEQQTGRVQEERREQERREYERKEQERREHERREHERREYERTEQERRRETDRRYTDPNSRQDQLREFERRNAELTAELNNLRNTADRPDNTKLAETVRENTALKTEIRAQREEIERLRAADQRLAGALGALRQQEVAMRSVEQQRVELQRQLIEVRNGRAGGDGETGDLAALRTEKRFLEEMRIPELTRQLNEQSQALARANEERHRAEELGRDLAAQLRRAEGALADLQREIGGLRGEAQRVQPTLARLAELEARNGAMAAEHEAMLQNMRRQGERLIELERVNGSLEERCQQLHGRPQEGKPEYKREEAERMRALVDKLNAVTGENVALRGKAAELAGTVSGLEKQIAMFEAARAAAEREAAEQRARLQDTQRQLDESRRESAETRAATKNAERDAAEHRAELARVKDDAAARLAKLGDELRAATAQLQRETLQREELAGRNARLQAELERRGEGGRQGAGELQRELGRLQELKGGMEAEFKRLREEIEASAAEARKGAAAQERAAQLQAELDRLRSIAERATQDAQRARDLAAEVTAMRDKMAKANDELRKREQEANLRNQIEVGLIALKDELRAVEEMLAQFANEKLLFDNRPSARSAERRALGNRTDDFRRAQKYLSNALLQRLQQLERLIAQNTPQYAPSLLAAREELRAEVKSMLMNIGQLHTATDDSTDLNEQLKARISELSAAKQLLADILRHLLGRFDLLPSEIDRLLDELLRAATLDSALTALGRWELPFRAPRRSANAETAARGDDGEARRASSPAADQLLRQNQQLASEKQKLKDKVKALKEQLRGAAAQDALSTSFVMPEVQRLREENAVLSTRLEVYQNDIRSKKKILLNELVNFVNSKNTFENSCYAELTRYSCTS